MGYPYDGILVGHKKEESIDKCSSKDGPWKRYANKPDTKGHILYDSTSIKYMD